MGEKAKAKAKGKAEVEAMVVDLAKTDEWYTYLGRPKTFFYL